MANWLQNSGLNKFDWIALGCGVGALLLGLGSAIGTHKGNQVRVQQINGMLDSRLTQPQNTPIKK